MKQLIVLLSVACAVAAYAGITRDDVAETRYTALARQKQFDCVGQVLKGKEAIGSCVLIDKKYVLTAAHIFIESSERPDTTITDGQNLILYVPYNEHVGNIRNYYFHINGKKYRGKSLKIFPTYGDSATAGTCDLAVVELADEVKGISPAVINTAFNELGANVVGVGFGASGIAGKPSTVKFRNKKIAGENIIDSLAGYELNGVSTLLQCDFDHPTNAECNQMGTALPRPLEYICTGGDSGGGLFRQTVNGWELVGICSGSAVNIDRLMKTGYYGQVMSWTRVSVFNDWIFENFR